MEVQVRAYVYLYVNDSQKQATKPKYLVKLKQFFTSINHTDHLHAKKLTWSEF
jgi:hypothetical protein